jgi:hypothetical protein
MLIVLSKPVGRFQRGCPILIRTVENLTMRWLKQHPVAINLILAFAIAVLVSLWVNYFTAPDPMPDRKHLLMGVAIILLGIQCGYNLNVSRAKKRIIYELLDLGVHFFIANANTPITSRDLRIIVHLWEKTRPGKDLPAQRCLVPKYWKAETEPWDYRAIPLDWESIRRWFINVKAFHEQRVICGEPSEPDPLLTAELARLFVHAPFAGKSIISAPVWSRKAPLSVIGTLTCDSVRGMEELDWCKKGVINENAKNMLEALANSIGRIISNDEENAKDA